MTTETPTTEETQSIEYGSSLDHITALVKAGVPYIWVTTHEENRFTQNLVNEVGLKLNKEIFHWSVYQGILPFNPKSKETKAKGDLEKTGNPVFALQYIEAYENKSEQTGSIWIMRDFGSVCKDMVPRQMRDLYQNISMSRKTIVIVSPSLCNGTKPGLDPTLDKQVIVVPYDLPSKGQVEASVNRFLLGLKQKSKTDSSGYKVKYTPEDISKFVTALQGLTELEIQNALFTSVCHLGRIDEKKLLREKKQIVQRSEVLEYIGVTPTMSDVGGLDAAKKYFATYSKQFSKEAVAYGVDPLKGVLLVGICGCGKSLIAKAVAASWSLPLIRLDVGKVMQGLVGASEMNMRTAIAQIEAMAPAVVWLDEIEKGLSGTKSSNFSDGGTLARVFGTLLTAMEERMQGIIILATANDIQALPPELIRRFNEVMFVDLPYDDERREIFEIHLRKRGRDINKLHLNMNELVKITKMFTGSEIEKAVKEGIARAFQSGKADVGQEELEGAIKDTKGIAKVMKDQIETIRDWAVGKARYASSKAEQENLTSRGRITTKSGKELDLTGELDDLNEIEGKKQPVVDEAEQARMDNL